MTSTYPSAGLLVMQAINVLKELLPEQADPLKRTLVITEVRIHVVLLVVVLIVVLGSDSEYYCPPKRFLTFL